VRRALISDIHGNLEALEVVLDDIKAQGLHIRFVRLKKTRTATLNWHRNFLGNFVIRKPRFTRETCCILHVVRSRSPQITSHRPEAVRHTTGNADTKKKPVTLTGLLPDCAVVSCAEI